MYWILENVSNVKPTISGTEILFVLAMTGF